MLPNRPRERYTKSGQRAHMSLLQHLIQQDVSAHKVDMNGVNVEGVKGERVVEVISAAVGATAHPSVMTGTKTYDKGSQ
jgi:hypothetical protein